MGCYDILPNGSQVKCWGCDMTEKVVGDRVFDFLLPEYVVLLQEGGFVRVVNGVIQEIVEDETPRYPEDFTCPCIDKQGSGVPDKDHMPERMFGFPYYDTKEEVVQALNDATEVK